MSTNETLPADLCARAAPRLEQTLRAGGWRDIRLECRDDRLIIDARCPGEPVEIPPGHFELGPAALIALAAAPRPRPSPTRPRRRGGGDPAGAVGSCGDGPPSRKRRHREFHVYDHFWMPWPPLTPDNPPIARRMDTTIAHHRTTQQSPM